MSAKKRKMGIVFLAMITMAFLASTGFAVEGSEPTTVTLQGYVSVLRDANDLIVSVQLVTDEDTYNVVLDAKGLELGEQMEDKEVEVEGVVSEEDDQKWLKVLAFKEIGEWEE
jgi:uncharacterized protein YggE